MRWQSQNADALKELQEKHMVQVLKTPEDILYEFLKAWDRIAAREAEKNPFFMKVLDSQRRYAKRAGQACSAHQEEVGDGP